MNPILKSMIFTSSTELIYTGFSIPIAKGTYYAITFGAMHNNAVPVKIGVNTSKTTFNSNLLATSLTGYILCSCTVTGCAESDIELCLWVQYTSPTSSNVIFAKGFTIQYNTK